MRERESHSYVTRVIVLSTLIATVPVLLALSCKFVCDFVCVDYLLYMIIFWPFFHSYIPAHHLFPAADLTFMPVLVFIQILYGSFSIFPFHLLFLMILLLPLISFLFVHIFS